MACPEIVEPPGNVSPSDIALQKLDEEKNRKLMEIMIARTRQNINTCTGEPVSTSIGFSGFKDSSCQTSPMSNSLRDLTILAEDSSSSNSNPTATNKRKSPASLDDFSRSHHPNKELRGNFGTRSSAPLAFSPGQP